VNITFWLKCPSAALQGITLFEILFLSVCMQHAEMFAGILFKVLTGLTSMAVLHERLAALSGVVAAVSKLSW